VADAAVDAGSIDADAAPEEPEVLPPDALPLWPDVGAPARLVLDRTRQEFSGATDPRCQTMTVDFRVTNQGDRTSGPLMVATAGEDFRVVGGSCQARPLEAGASCTIAVEFRPAAPGQRSDLLTVTATPGGTTQAMLVGAALIADAVSLTPNAADFGGVTLGRSGPTRSFELHNTGGSRLQVGQATVSTESFVVVSNRCNGVGLDSGQVCTIEVAFRPSTIGAKSAILTVPAEGCGAGPMQAALQGFCVDGGGMNLTPTDVEFGDSCSAKPATFTVTNPGADPGGAVTVTISGPFAIVSNDCVGALKPAQSCQVRVEYRPTTTASSRGSLVVTWAIGNTVTANLSGKGRSQLEPVLGPLPQFPATLVGQTSAPVELVVDNPSGAPAAKLTSTFTGIAAAEYKLIGSDCGTIAGGAACRLRIAFTPAAVGVRNATLLITSDACPNGSVAVPLTGAGM